MIIKPSLPLLVVMGSYYLLFPNLNSFLITAIFILTQWVYLIATKDEGYYNLVHEYHNSKKKLKSAF